MPRIRLLSPVVSILRASALVATTAAAFAVADPPGPGATSVQPSAEIRAAIDAYQKAFARGDGAALEALWMPDGDIVDDEGRVLNGREAVAGIRPPAAGAAAPSPLRIKETSLRLVTADVAIEDGTVEIAAADGAAPLTGWFSATWVRHEGRWRLAAVRESQTAAATVGPRLTDLDWMVGEWTVVEDRPDRPADAAAPADGAAIEVSVRWNDTRTFLLRDMRVGRRPAAGKQAEDEPALQITQRIGWDPLSRQIVSWVFGSDGSHGEATWTRDGDTWIARTMAVLPDGTQTSALNIYTYDGADRCTWRSVPTHVGGEHAAHLTMTMIRRPAPRGTQAR